MDVIAKLGGPTAVFRALKWRDPTARLSGPQVVRHWRTRGIPRWWRAHINALIKKMDG